MERHTRSEFNNPHQELIQTYPILKEHPLFLLDLIQEIRNNYEKSISPEVHRSSSQSKKLEEDVRNIVEEKLVPIVDIISGIDQDELIGGLDSLMDKFKEILSSDNLVESSSGKGGRISRIHKIHAIINILDYYGNKYIPLDHANDPELRDSHFQNIVSLIVDLMYRKIVKKTDGLQVTDGNYEFSAYGPKVADAIINSFKALGFAMKKNAKKRYRQDGTPIPDNYFFFNVDVDASNKMVYQA